MDAWLKKYARSYPQADYRAAQTLKEKSPPKLRFEATPGGLAWRAIASPALSDGACELAGVLFASGAGSESMKQGLTRRVEVVLTCTKVEVTAVFHPAGRDGKSGAYLEVNGVRRPGGEKYAVGAGAYEWSPAPSERKPAPPSMERNQLVAGRYEVAAAGLGLKVTADELAKLVDVPSACWPAAWGDGDRHCAARVAVKGADRCGAAALLVGLLTVQREVDLGLETTLTHEVRVNCDEGWAAEASFAKPGQVTLRVADAAQDEPLPPKSAPLPPTASLSSEAPAAGAHAKQVAERTAPRDTAIDRSGEAFMRALLAGPWFGLAPDEVPKLAGDLAPRLNRLAQGLRCKQTKGQRPEVSCDFSFVPDSTPAQCRLFAFGAAFAFPEVSPGPLAGVTDFALELPCERTSGTVLARRQGDTVTLVGPSGGDDEVGLEEAMMGDVSDPLPAWSARLEKVKPLPPLKAAPAKKR